MNCPHCDKVIIVRAFKDDGKSNPQDRATSSGGDLESLMSAIHDDELENDFEIGFMKDFRARFEKYGDRTIVSEKQMNVLRKIAAGSAD